jgi:nucleotide-binding universal stress UspA family protein
MKILMAYDATADGRAGLLTTPELAWLPHEEMHLLAVMPMPSGLFLGEGYVPGEIRDEDRAQAQAELDAGVAELVARGFNAKGLLSFGEPVDEICRTARVLGSNLIMVRHPRRISFAARWWKGWVGASLLEHAPCSILITVSHDPGKG